MVKEENRAGTIAMILGIAGLVLTLNPLLIVSDTLPAMSFYATILSFILCPVAFILGLFAVRRTPKGRALTGVVTGGIGTFLCLIWLVLLLALGRGLSHHNHPVGPLLGNTLTIDQGNLVR